MKHDPWPHVLKSTPNPLHTFTLHECHTGQRTYLTIQIKYMELHGDVVELTATSLHIYDAWHMCDTEQDTCKCATDMQGDWLRKNIVTCSNRTHNTHIHAHTLFIEIQYPGDALQSLVCLCRARWILRQMGCFSQTPKTFSQLLTAVYRYLRKTTNFHHAQQKVVVLFSIITT